MKVSDILRVKGNTLFTVTPDTGHVPRNRQWMACDDDARVVGSHTGLHWVFDHGGFG
jgi:hypothetical protein